MSLSLLTILLGTLFSKKGAEPSTAGGRYSEAQHGQNKEKPNEVLV